MDHGKVLLLSMRCPISGNRAPASTGQWRRFLNPIGWEDGPPLTPIGKSLDSAPQIAESAANLGQGGWAERRSGRGHALGGANCRRKRAGGSGKLVLPGIRNLEGRAVSFPGYSSGAGRSLAFEHSSQVSCWPVYPHMRPM